MQQQERYRALLSQPLAVEWRRSADDKVMDDLKTLWREHREAAFPPRCRGREIHGIKLVMLDADVAGCVDRFLTSGELNAQHAAILGRCYRDASLAARELKESEEQVYFARLERIAAAVLEALSFARPRQN